MKAVPLLYVATFKLRSAKNTCWSESSEIPTHTIIGVDGSYRETIGAWGVIFTKGCYEGASLYGNQSDHILLPYFDYNKLISQTTHIKMSSNRAESQAMLIALFLCKWIQSTSDSHSFEIVTDSLGVVNSINKFQGWKDAERYIKNYDLLSPIYALYSAIKNIKIIHVHGHISVTRISRYPEFNSEKIWKANKDADKLAKKGLTSESIDFRSKHLFYI